MSFRFGKRVKIAPGITLNFGKRGISTTLGPRGASVNLGRKGVYLNASIPGTGLSWRSRVGGSAKSPAPVQPDPIRRGVPPPLSRSDVPDSTQSPQAVPPPVPPPVPGPMRPANSPFATFLMVSGVLFWIVAALVALALYSA